MVEELIGPLMLWPLMSKWRERSILRAVWPHAGPRRTVPTSWTGYRSCGTGCRVRWGAAGSQGSGWAAWLPSATPNIIFSFPLCNQEAKPGATALGRRLRHLRLPVGATCVADSWSCLGTRWQTLTSEGIRLVAMAGQIRSYILEVGARSYALEVWGK